MMACDGIKVSLAKVLENLLTIRELCKMCSRSDDAVYFRKIAVRLLQTSAFFLTSAF